MKIKITDDTGIHVFHRIIDAGEYLLSAHREESHSVMGPMKYSRLCEYVRDLPVTQVTVEKVDHSEHWMNVIPKEKP